ncbi:MAG: molybdopterin-dependent oxidoreductase [Alphaproteobacteria bacterium]|nr:molybdopterin-dependent oxidoreductase [Alphaproteobacteria bacterium]
MTVRLVPNHAHWGAFLAEVEDGRIVGVRPFEHDPDPSPIIQAIPDAVHSSMRIPRPMVREGWLRNGPGGSESRGREPFVPVSWDRALKLVADELARVRRDHGNGAIMGGSQGWGSAGIFHHARTQLRRFLGAFGGFVDQATNYSFGAALAFLPHVVGTPQAVTGPLTSWSSIARHTKLMVLFGGANPKNMQVTLGGSAAHSTGGWLEELARRGVEVVNVSPLRDDGPEVVSPAWIPIRPGTDTAMILALTHAVIAEDLHDREFLATCCTGFERVRSYLTGEQDGQPKDAAWASGITGVPAETIRDLARRMASTRTMLTASWSMQRADHGEQVYWSLILLASVLGQIGLPGGGFGFGYGSIAGVGDPPPAFPPPAMPMGGNPIGAAIPAARIADCLLNPGAPYDFNGKTGTYPDIRLVYWAGGNPFHHHQDLNRLRRAWGRPETVIVHEPWWTATARHADIVLPATTSLERNDIGAAARDRFVIAMQQAIPPVGQARNDFDILRDLSRRLGCEETFTEDRDEMEWLRHLYQRCSDGARTNSMALPDFDTFWTQEHLEVPPREEEHVLFGEFRGDPETCPLRTPSGRIELYSERIAGFGYDDCPPHPAWLEPAEWLGARHAAKHSLHLISSQPRHRLHSQMDGGPVSARGKIGGREAIWMNPLDAADRALSDGDVVRVFNERGACLAGVAVSEAVSRGVVRLSCGAWYDPVDQLEAPLCAHGNANVLTLDKGTSRLGQGPCAGTALVEIERMDSPPPVRAFTAPRIQPAG